MKEDRRQFERLLFSVLGQYLEKMSNRILHQHNLPFSVYFLRIFERLLLCGSNGVVVVGIYRRHYE